METDARALFDPDCSTCSHRAERHPSRHADPSKPRSLHYVCMVCGKAIGEHGCWTSRGGWDRETGAYGDPHWVQDVPCKAYDKALGRWVALDHDPIETEEET